MKKTFLLIATFATCLFASCNKDPKPQEEPKDDPKPEVCRVLEDFENGGMLTWNAESGAQFTIVANPSKGGINTSDNVGKYVCADAEWDFTWTTAFGGSYDNPDYLKFTQDGYIVTVQCYAPAAGIPVYLKLEGDGVDPCEITSVVTTKANEWEVLEFDYEPNSLPDGAYRNFVICADAGGTTAGTVLYFDNFKEIKGE